jgi:hypothetical protein
MKPTPIGVTASLALLAAAAAAVTAIVVAGAQEPSREERFRKMSTDAETKGLAEPFKGITTDGTPVPGLFPIRSTGVSTAPVKAAADAFLASLTAEQRTRTLYAVDDPEWRKWMNQSFYVRQGVGFNEMSEAQRDAAFGLLRASLSARGLTLTRDIMRLNETLAEMSNDFAQYGEWRYWITVMGRPSATEPWGWQFDGHHAILNYFVLGDQVVMTPAFFGSEPTVAESGKYKGTRILDDEQRLGLEFLGSLNDAQRAKAVLSVSKTGNNTLSEAFRDNVVLAYAGVRATDLRPDQRTRLLGLVERYVGTIREGHARVKMSEVRAHLDDTYFAWIGGSGPDSVFYYRIHSPVILIEFDHQMPVGLRHLYPDRRPRRDHVHAVVRTPNGNDYGKDLLRQHYEAHRNDPSHGHAH